MIHAQRQPSSATLSFDAGHGDQPRFERALLVVTSADSCHAFDYGARTSLTVGRAEPADILLPDGSLSRLHACFRREAEGVRVIDLGSRNGTWVGGERIEEALLTVGKRALLGGVSVSLQLEAAASTPAKVASALHDASHAGLMIRRSPAMLQLHALVRRAAQHRIGVLLLGETGTGKELVARELHDLGPRRAAPMQVVNCAAIPEALIESVLFGHVKGAFTGAMRDRAGVFAQAHRGTVFLDEVGELSRDAQAALLRVLESQRVCPVGSSQEVQVDVRVIAATHRDLGAMAQAGGFRLDLYHRLNALTLELPPLRDRLEEIEPLASYFLQRSGSKLSLSGEALDCLRAYPWPGNVRELRNVVERAVVLCERSQIGAGDLPAHVRNSVAPAAASPSAEPVLALQSRSLVAPALPQPASSVQGVIDLRARMMEHELELITEALRRSGGHRRHAAQLLRLPLRTFERKLQILGRRGPKLE